MSICINIISSWCQIKENLQVFKILPNFDDIWRKSWLSDYEGIFQKSSIRIDIHDLINQSLRSNRTLLKNSDAAFLQCVSIEEIQLSHQHRIFIELNTKEF